jgi:hypothetical protein
MNPIPPNIAPDVFRENSMAEAVKQQITLTTQTNQRSDSMPDKRDADPSVHAPSIRTEGRNPTNTARFEDCFPLLGGRSDELFFFNHEFSLLLWFVVRSAFLVRQSLDE